MELFNNSDIDEMVNILKNDGILSVPTDTIYGLCVRINSINAFNKLMQVKNRPSNKSFSMMCASIEDIKKYAIVDDRAERIIQAFMPGPITIILKKKEDSINNNGKYQIDSIGIRMATSETLKKIISKLGCPVFMTSANISGMPVCQSIDEIRKVFPLIDGILVGDVSYGKASTIVDCTNKKIVLLREGPITNEQIEEVL